MQHIEKEYDQSFVLEPTKLTSLVEKMHERLAELQNTTQHDKFELFLSNHLHEEFTDIEKVLSHQNSRKHKIKRLLVICSATTKSLVHPEHEVRVDFGGPKITPGSTSQTKIVAVNVRSTADGWVGRTLSDVEEQIERTRQYHYRPILALVGLLICVIIILLFHLKITDSGEDSRWMWLHNADLDRVAAIVRQSRTASDEELREVATMQLRNLLGAARPPTQTGSDRSLLFLMIPISVVVICVVTLLVRCYPKATFLWGDEIEEYKKMRGWRTALWGIIISVTVVGISADLLFQTFASWIQH